MSTAIGTVESEGMFGHSIEVYNGVQHIVLFIQNDLDREGKGTKILLNEDKWKALVEHLNVAGQVKGWSLDNI